MMQIHQTGKVNKWAEENTAEPEYHILVYV